MTASVRLAGVRWFQRIRDHLAQKAVKVLSRYEVHPDPREYVDLGLVVRVPDNTTEAQRNGSVVLPSLHDQVHAQWGGNALAKSSELITEGNRLQLCGHLDIDPRGYERQAQLWQNYLRNRGLPGGDA